MILGLAAIAALLALDALLVGVEMDTFTRHETLMLIATLSLASVLLLASGAWLIRRGNGHQAR